MRLNIQTKVFILLTGLTTLILTGVLWIITTTVSEKVEEKIIEDFNKTQSFFMTQQRLIYLRLVESCYLIAENSTFKANVALNDPASVQFTIEEFADFASVDLFTVTDPRGKVLGSLTDSEVSGDDISDRVTVTMALNGVEPEFAPDWAELWEIDGDIYQVVSLPVLTGDFTILGTITLGTLITVVEARDLKGESNIEISMFSDSTVFASTIGDSLTPELIASHNQFVKQHYPLIDAVNSSLSNSDAFIATINSKEVYAFLSPLGKGARSYYLATVEKSLELRVLNSLQQNIYLTGLVSLLITVLLAFVLGRTITGPILRLVKGMQRVTDGDLSITVKPSTNDEIGLLTKTFNDMIIGLRERLHLMRYVGSHTVEMVKKSSEGEVSLGGDRRELVVLFSDIRGFTAYSENRTPEEVVNMLNRYLGKQAEIVDRYNGSVDKFVGDEMVALFSGEDAITSAIDCAIDIQNWIQKEHESDPAPVFIGIGINFGPMILGNMGATERMDYTVIGAAVNLGARLCSSAAAGQILIRDELLKNTQKKYRTGLSQKMSFKGFSQELEIVEVLGAYE